MKECPTCGAQCGDDDGFCEADGTNLNGGSARGLGADELTPLVDTCPHCGARHCDDGEGYCSSCGYRLSVSIQLTPPVGSLIDGHRISAARSNDDVLVELPGPAMGIAGFGDGGPIGREAAALRKLDGKAPFPAFVSEGKHAEFSFVISRVALADAQPLTQRVPPLRVEEAIVVVERFLDIAGAVDAAGFFWQPYLDDLYLAADGSLRLARLRVGPLGPGGLDARALVTLLGDCLLPEPSVRGSTSLVRLLMRGRDDLHRNDSSLAKVRAEVGRLRAEVRVNEGPVASVCDPGLWRPYNQDVTVTESGDYHGDRWTVLVVCDGVSSSSRSEEASSAATAVVSRAMCKFAASGEIEHASAASALDHAIREAHRTICDNVTRASTLPGNGDDEPPGTTLVAAFIYRNRLTVGWVGDSRAYWVTPGGAEQLTRDHSWVNEAVDSGEMTEEEALKAPLAHAILRCLGPLEIGGAITDVVPDLRSRHLAGPGAVVLCSDGLWNYAPHEADVAKLVRAAGPVHSAAFLARFLVNHALVAGGQDNVSVAVYLHDDPEGTDG